MPDQALLHVQDVAVGFPVRRQAFRQQRHVVHAVDGVSFTLERGETLGLVGESGCGKSTTARAIAMLLQPTQGSIKLDGVELVGLSSKSARALRRRLQIVFQDPYSSLDPRMKVGSALVEPLAIHKLATRAEARRRALQILDAVGLEEEALDRYPHEFSGGQRQRIAIARALVVSPELLICDEPVSALDVSVQAQIVNLLTELRTEFELALLFIAHDLAVVRHISDRIAVMYLGEIVELGGADEVALFPLHPYTQSLISAVASPDPAEQTRRRIVLQGDVPSPIDPPPGCRFHTRCPHARDRCRHERPVLARAEGNRTVACHFWREIAEPKKPQGKRE
jgi:oligopeptide transport system ATP-binding protein